MPQLTQVLGYLEQFAPLSLAADWDNVGLLLGRREGEVSKILTCLTLTPEVAAEAISCGVQLIVSHHPILFKAVRKLTSDNPEGRMLLSLIQANVAVYSPHTAFDNARDGINDQLARKMGLIDAAPLRTGAGPKQVKLVVFVPEADLDKVSEAMWHAGAGRIGEYSECSYRLLGTGTFRGSAASNPTIGQKGMREEVKEWRLEVVCPERKVSEIVAAMRKAHCYEEVAFDLYPLTTLSTTGEGRLGKLSDPMSLSDLVKRLRDGLGTGPVQVVGELTKPVQKVAIVCGAGGEMFGDAVRARADVFVTGEMRYHDYLAALSQGVGLILLGHHASERCGVEDLADRLAKQWPGVEVWASRQERDPVAWV